MQSHVIENMNAADLKAQRAELVAAIVKEPPPDLAERYVQARTDAALRDEKLAEQGRTITTLNDLVAEKSATILKREADIRDAESRGNQLAAELDACRKAAATQANESQQAMSAVQAMLKDTEAARVAAVNLATARRKALVDVLKLVGDLNAKVGPLLIEE